MSTTEKQDERVPLQTELAAFTMFTVVAGLELAKLILPLCSEEEKLAALLETSAADEARVMWQKLEPSERSRYRSVAEGLRLLLDAKKVKHLKSAVATLEVRPVTQAYSLREEMARN